MFWGWHWKWMSLICCAYYAHSLPALYSHVDPSTPYRLSIFDIFRQNIYLWYIYLCLWVIKSTSLFYAYILSVSNKTALVLKSQVARLLFEVQSKVGGAHRKSSLTDIYQNLQRTFISSWFWDHTIVLLSKAVIDNNHAVSLLLNPHPNLLFPSAW